MPASSLGLHIKAHKRRKWLSQNLKPLPNGPKLNSIHSPCSELGSLQDAPQQAGYHTQQIH